MIWLACVSRDPRRLLAPVLQGVEGEVGEPGDVAVRRVHAEHTALVARPVPVVEVECHRASRRSRVTAASAQAPASAAGIASS